MKSYKRLAIRMILKYLDMNMFPEVGLLRMVIKNYYLMRPEQNINTNPIHFQITPKHQHETQPDTNKTYTPQPSTPIKHAGSDYSWMKIGRFE